MALHKVRIQRTVIVLDEVVRYIDAPTWFDARKIAWRVADSYNGDCPEDAEDMGVMETKDWEPHDLVEEVAELPAGAVLIEPDAE